MGKHPENKRKTAKKPENPQKPRDPALTQEVSVSTPLPQGNQCCPTADPDMDVDAELHAARLHPKTRPLSRDLQKVWIFRNLARAPEPREAPRRPPLGYPWAFPGPPRAPRRPPEHKTTQSKKPRNLKELTEQWRKDGGPCASPSRMFFKPLAVDTLCHAIAHPGRKSP